MHYPELHCIHTCIHLISKNQNFTLSGMRIHSHMQLHMVKQSKTQSFHAFIHAFS